MNIVKLNTINKLFFSTADIARQLNISQSSAKVTASRYVQNNWLIRPKRDLYMLSNRFDIMNDEERFKLANLIQTPSYISLTTALGYFDLTTQQQQQFVESIALKRSKMVTVKRISFNYTLVKDSIYHHFYLQNGFFIASPEKALVDAVYLSAMRRYKCDFHAIKFSQINVQLVDELIKNTNKKTIIHWWEICKIFKL